jgi:hypothetical protein
VDGTGTGFVDDGGRTIADYNASGAEIQHYVYGADSTPACRNISAATPLSPASIISIPTGSAR